MYNNVKEREEYIIIRLFLEEYLDEMSTICRDNKNNVSVAVNPDSNRQGNPYFKFYNSASHKSATNVIRILFNSADYVDPINTDGKKLWKLSHKDKKVLMELLNEPSSDYSDMTTWEACKFRWNVEYFEFTFYRDKYINGEYDKDKTLAENPSYVPYSLKMPDYNKIEL